HRGERGAPSGTGSYVCPWFRGFTLAQDSRTELSESAKLCPIDLGGSIRTLLLLGLLAAIPPGVADPRLGSWTLVSAQSSLDPPNRLSITPLHGGVHVGMSGEKHFDFTANRNGHDSPAPGNLAFNQIFCTGSIRNRLRSRRKKTE